MKFILISPKNRTAYNFRGDLVQEICRQGYEVIITGPNQDNVAKIEELGARFVEIPMNKNGVNPASDLLYLKRLYSLFKAEKPDVTLGYTIKPVIYGAIAAKLAGVKHRVSMVTGAGYVFTAKTFKAKVIKFIVSVLYKIGFKCANTVVFQNSDDLEQFTGNKLVKEEKCRVVNGSGVNMEKFQRMEYPEQITFFMLSRIMFSKGIREYLAACEKLKEKYPQTRFMLLGALENIQDSLKQDDLKPYIDKGIIEHFGETECVADYYKMCSVYVLPSYREGTPRTVLEAMAMGRAIVTTDAPGCRETVIDGKTGFLVPVGNSEELAKAMERFILEPALIQTMGEASYQYCKEKFDVLKVNEDMLKYLKIGGQKQDAAL